MQENEAGVTGAVRAEFDPVFVDSSGRRKKMLLSMVLVATLTSGTGLATVLYSVSAPSPTFTRTLAVAPVVVASSTPAVAPAIPSIVPITAVPLPPTTSTTIVLRKSPSAVKARLAFTTISSPATTVTTEPPTNVTPSDVAAPSDAHTLDAPTTLPTS